MVAICRRCCGSSCGQHAATKAHHVWETGRCYGGASRPIKRLDAAPQNWKPKYIYNTKYIYLFETADWTAVAANMNGIIWFTGGKQSKAGVCDKMESATIARRRRRRRSDTRKNKLRTRTKAGINPENRHGCRKRRDGLLGFGRHAVTRTTAIEKED